MHDAAGNRDGAALAILDPDVARGTHHVERHPAAVPLLGRHGPSRALDLKAPPLGFIKACRSRRRACGSSRATRSSSLSDGFAERFDAAGAEWGYDTVERELERICGVETSADGIARRLVDACDDSPAARSPRTTRRSSSSPRSRHSRTADFIISLCGLREARPITRPAGLSRARTIAPWACARRSRR